MIVREYLSCGTCGNAHVARVQVGRGGRQEHTFLCIGCKEPIQVAMDVDNATSSLKFHLITNCVPSNDPKGIPVYLSPDFVADKEHLNDPFYFGSLSFIHSIMSSPVARDMVLNNQGKASGKNILDTWTTLKKIWRLENSGQYAISGSLNYQFSCENNIEEINLRESLSWFLGSTFSIDRALFDEVKKIMWSNTAEFKRFLHFYQTNMRLMHRRSQFELISDYFDSYQTFSQVYPYVRSGMPLPPSAMATSLNFNEIKSFYAKAYEFYASAVCIFTCLNNIKEGRPFDKLKNILLAKYLTTDKAERRNSFGANEIFTSAADEFDSKLRNASFHNWFFLKADNQTIEYRSGGTGELNSITYTEYLYRCSLMLAQIWRLFSLELMFDHLACEVALVTRHPMSKLLAST